MTNNELNFVCDAIEQVSLHYKKWQKDYEYNSITNEFENAEIKETIAEEVNEWFKLD
ncbi:hypothetical protein SAMN05444397_11618 [Flavobacterium aquidurense]|nr:hypothetical protein SAMN05444397_11618 [Flavobacterium aquidurense]